MNFRTQEVDYSSLFTAINNSNEATTQYTEFAASKHSADKATMQSYYSSVSAKADETQQMLNHAEHVKTAGGQPDVLEAINDKTQRPYTGEGTYGNYSLMGANFDTIS